MSFGAAELPAGTAKTRSSWATRAAEEPRRFWPAWPRPAAATRWIRSFTSRNCSCTCRRCCANCRTRNYANRMALSTPGSPTSGNGRKLPDPPLWESPLLPPCLSTCTSRTAHEFSSRMRPAARARDRVARHHPVVAAVGIRQQNLRIVFQKFFRPLAPAVQREVEHIVRIRFVAHVHPQARRPRLPRVLHRERGVVGGHHVRLPHPAGHAFIERLDDVGHVAAPDRLRGPRNLEALPRKQRLQPVQREIVGKLAGDDERQ